MCGAGLRLTYLRADVALFNSGVGVDVRMLGTQLPRSVPLRAFRRYVILTEY